MVMKRLSVAIVVVFFLCKNGWGQRYESPVVMYYLPFNSLVFDIEYEETKFVRGIYHDYAKSLLGVSNIPTKNNMTYRLLSIKSDIETKPDYSRSFIIQSLKKSMPKHYVNLSDEGILLGYNIPPSKKEKKAAPSAENVKLTLKLKSIDSDLLLMPEEYAKDLPMRVKAKMVADQIFRLREARLYILSGESEHLPADKSLELMLRELERQETDLLELFVGRTITTIKTKSLSYTPSKNESKVLFFFNKNKGPIEVEKMITKSSDDIPIMLTIKTFRPTLKPLDKKAIKANAQLVSELYYNLPGRVSMQVYNKDTVFIQKEEAIAQLGVAIPLNISIIEKEETHIYFNEQTGNIKSINH